MKLKFKIGERVKMVDGGQGVITAIELVTTGDTDGLGISVSNTTEKARAELLRHEKLGMFTLRFGVQLDGDEKTRFHFEESIQGGNKHPFGKGGL